MNSLKDSRTCYRAALKGSLLALALFTTLHARVEGSLSLGPYYFDGVTTWHGTSGFSNGILHGSVEWAVYAPGTFPYAGYSQPAGEYVYAYQVSMDPDSVGVSHLSVALTNPADTIGDFPLPGGTAPSVESLTPFSSADYFFDPESFPLTSGLAFSSPDAPIMLFGSIADGGLAFIVDQLPSPGIAGSVPEAGTWATWLLLGASCGSVAFCWRRPAALRPA
ncbi:MAG: hypothetical protein HYX69_18510 [Planctomycetia bacterium]|nr:hypothetical protein [Planctomycetia bacterium]